MKVQLELPPVKKRAITEPGYGNNAKVLVGFRSRPWQTLGYSGSTYSDQAFQSALRAETRSDHQVWETVAAELCFNPRSAPKHGATAAPPKRRTAGDYIRRFANVHLRATIANADLSKNERKA